MDDPAFSEKVIPDESGEVARFCEREVYSRGIAGSMGEDKNISWCVHLYARKKRVFVRLVC